MSQKSIEKERLSTIKETWILVEKIEATKDAEEASKLTEEFLTKIKRWKELDDVYFH